MRRRIWFHIGILCVLLLSALPGRPLRAQPLMLHVTPGGLEAGSCDSWANACSLRYALVSAASDQEIWVAAGVYRPTELPDRTATFQLHSDVAVYGGFPPGGGIWEERDWLAHETYLSGDVGAVGDPSDNSYHVVTFPVTSTVILDGFFIVDGNADGVGFDCFGGGIFNSGGNPTIRNIGGFANNHAACSGGGMYNGLGSDPMLENVTFSGNTAGGAGGGLYNDGGDLFLGRCTIEGNWSGSHGGGIFSVGGSLTLDDCLVEGNVATGHGGGFANLGGLVRVSSSQINQNAAQSGGGAYNSDFGTMFIADSTFNLNSADEGGAIHNDGSGSVTVTNSTISGNEARYGGGISTTSWWDGTSLYNVTVTGNVAGGGTASDGGGLWSEDGIFNLYNSIIAGNWDLSPGLYSPDCSIGGALPPSEVEYTLIGDETGCEGLFDAGLGNLVGNSAAPLDPRLFRLADNGGPTLTHALVGDSPAREAGDPDGCLDPGGLLLATDQRGVSRPRGGVIGVPPRCDMGAFEAGLGNDVWTRAFRLDVGSDPYQDAVDQYLESLGESRWYRFSVSPGSRVNVTLAPGNVNLDIALYQDIQAAYDKLSDVTDESDLLQLTAEFAGDAFAPDSYAADAFSPEAYAPMAYSPMAYSPMAYSPMAYSPMAYSPMAYSPMAYSPMAYSPMAYSPMAYSPMAYSPMAYSPDNFVPDDAYSVAQVHSLVGVSAFDGLASESISVNTWDNGGDFYVRVIGRNGAFDPPAPAPFESVPFHLEVSQEVGVCGGVELIERDDPPAVVPGPWQTLILADWERMALDPAELSELQGAVGVFATQVGGLVVDVGEDPLVDLANAEAGDPANVACPFAKNQVAALIKDHVNAYREADPGTLDYVVILGNDDVIPFYRHPDRALLANEKNYVPPVFNDTASFASLHLGYVLSQDYYGSAVDLSLNNTILPIPELAVGRLVETPSDIMTLLDAYADLGGGAVVPQSAFVSGYDFLADAAEEVGDQLADGIGPNVDMLISAADVSPLDPAAWNADQLRHGLLSRRNDVIFLAGHFSASSALAADFETRLLASELAGSAVDLQNALVFSAGCHSGYNIVNGHGIPDVTVEPDWAQAFAQKGATFIGGTGYQYGDTDFLEYSERLYLELARHLRYGSGPVTVGEALVSAKQAYLAGTAEMRGIHEKALLEATLFGLPMLSLDMPQGRGDPPLPPSIVTGLSGFSAPSPGASLGLQYADVTVGSDLTRHTVTLYSVDDLYPDPPVTIDADYFSGRDGVVANPAEPVLPLERRNVSVPAVVLRSFGFLGGSYTDHTGLIPLTGAAATELRGVHAPFFSEVFFPIEPWRANYFDALTEPGSGVTWLNVMPAHFVSAGPDDWTGTIRAFDWMDFRLYYSANTATYLNGAVPALSAAPAIARVLATEEGGQITFNAWVVGDPAAGIQEVWVTHTSCDDADTCSGSWQSLFLTQDADDSTLWTGILDGAVPGDLHYIVQAANGAGLVSMADNLGQYFRVGVDPAAPSAGGDPADTALALHSPATAGAYSTEGTFGAWLTSDGAPVAGQKVQFALGAQERWATTDAGGYAEVTIPLLGTPGQHLLLASFAGNTEYVASSAQASFTIQKLGSKLQLSAQTDLAQYGIDAILVAQLTDAADRPLREKTVGFVVDLADPGVADYALTGITDLTGQVLLGPSSLPHGDYTIRAYFGLDVALPSGGSLALSDVNYDWAQTEHVVGSASVLSEITMDQSLIPAGTALVPLASFTDPDPADALRAVWDWGDGSTSAGTVSETDGNVSGSHLYATPGVYTLRLVLADEGGAYDEAVYQYVVVYDDSTGFVTGGGWIDSPPGAYTPDPALTGQANFGFVAKYKKGADVPTGQTQFRFQAGGLKFHSDSYDWLRVARHKAMFKGVGRVNGKDGYGFMLSAIDADLTPSTAIDLFRIKIWDRATDTVIYDNQIGESEDADPTTALGGGSIVIHTR